MVSFRVKFKISDEYPRLFLMGVPSPPGPRDGSFAIHEPVPARERRRNLIPDHSNITRNHFSYANLFPAVTSLRETNDDHRVFYFTEFKRGTGTSVS